MAIPSILQMLNKNQPTLPIQQIRQMIGTIRNANNPQALLEQMMRQNNPALSKAMDYIKQNGGDPKQAFEKLAAEKGVNPADLGL